MGSTVSTGKCAAAFRATSGKVVYVLWEETYEKNCHPHTPHWGCRSIGTIDRTIERIFLYGSAAEGGMLQNRSGHIRPENYIRGWMDEMVAPVEITDSVIKLHTGRGPGIQIREDGLEGINGAFSEFGRKDLIDKLAAGEVIDLSLYDDAELIMALHIKAQIPAWKIFTSSRAPHGDRNAQLGYSPAQAKKVDIKAPTVLKVDPENRIVLGEDGCWRCGGWEYSIIGRHIKNLWEIELREPGHYRKRIQTFRDAVYAAPRMPQGVKVVVDQTVPLEDSYQKDWVDRLPSTLPVTKTATGYEIAVTDDPQRLWHLTGLPEACTSWVIPNDQPERVQQGLLDLFAA